MSEEKRFSSNSIEEVARTFAEIVSRNYLEHLQFWQATAMDDSYEFNQWKLRIESEPEKVKKNAFDKILKIIKEPHNYKNFYKKKWWFFRSKNIISIIASSGFYKDLLPERSIEHTVSVNVEYLLDKKRFKIIKKVYSHYVKL